RLENLLQGQRRGRVDGQGDRAPVVDAANRRRPGHGRKLHEVAEPDDETGGGHQRSIRDVLGGRAAARAEDDWQPGLAVEIFTEPGTFADGSDHRAERCTIPADFGDAAVIRHRMQLERYVFRVWEALHGRAGEYLLEQRATLHGHAVERGRVFALQVDADRAGRATDAAEEIPFDREHARVRQAHRDLLAHQPLELPEAGLFDDPGADRATPRPREEGPVLQPRLRAPFHIGPHAVEKRRQQLTVHLFWAHAGWEVEEGVDGGALDRRQVVERRQQPPREQERQHEQSHHPGELPG